jgi:hypothetical protein
MPTHLFLGKLKKLVAFVTTEVLWMNINVKYKKPHPTTRRPNQLKR